MRLQLAGARVLGRLQSGCWDDGAHCSAALRPWAWRAQLRRDPLGRNTSRRNKMSSALMVRLAFTVSCIVPTAMAAQVPAELRETMRARDEAVAKADSATWDRLTTE